MFGNLLESLGQYQYPNIVPRKSTEKSTPNRFSSRKAQNMRSTNTFTRIELSSLQHLQTHSAMIFERFLYQFHKSH